MRGTPWKILIELRRSAALLMLLVLLAGLAPAGADTATRYDIDDITGETQIILAEAALQKHVEAEEELRGIRIRQNGQISGRGIPDEPPGAEPDYIGLVGYAAVANHDGVSLNTDGIGMPWTVPAYMLFEKRWYYTRSMQHKTGVLVIRQMLKQAGPNRYTGRLMVIRLDSGEFCWMDVENFVTVPYWFYPARRAVKYGNTAAAYSRRGTRFPTDEEGNPVEVADNTDVLIPGYGVWDKRAPEGSQMIPGIIFEEKITVTEKKVKNEEGEEETVKEERTEFVTTVLLFPEEDLTMIY